MKFIFVVVYVTLLAGCGLVSTSSEPVSVGPDTWFITAKDGVKGPSASQVKAMKEAGQHCTSMGLNLLVVSADESRGIASEVMYRCLAKDDPLLVRPDLKLRPDAVIRIE